MTKKRILNLDCFRRVSRILNHRVSRGSVGTQKRSWYFSKSKKKCIRIKDDV